ncbi:3-oxoacyl-(acyl carrier protein) reductase [Ophiocordyceps sinensis CO18]|uniref:3-oxoacyl-(Acyl carrier protein) reductase n=1 Tax=Ophiocordyceps sinensis (strain Co18 / CGMCC 3.14243) TaxID=911162 RepID=T5AAD7_OPHSC|nr:3-oxoacyl-(acyl carrier protein) reductase [Ophiocordyceps sinensis CO18]
MGEQITTMCEQSTTMPHQSASYPSLRGKTVLISGGAEGIGAAAVELFCRQGSRVVFLDYATGPAGRLCERMAGIPGATQPTFMYCDLTELEQVRRCAHGTLERFGGVDVLINNAGAGGPEARVATSELTAESFEAAINANLRHQVFLTQAVAPSMMGRGSGSIMPARFGPRGVRVNSIMPGAIATQRQLDTVMTDEYRAQCLRAQALKRVLMPVEVARLMLFLASDDASAMTGGSHVVDGGWVGDT